MLNTNAAQRLLNFRSDAKRLKATTSCTIWLICIPQLTSSPHHTKLFTQTTERSWELFIWSHFNLFLHFARRLYWINFLCCLPSHTPLCHVSQAEDCEWGRQKTVSGVFLSRCSNLNDENLIINNAKFLASPSTPEQVLLPAKPDIGAISVLSTFCVHTTLSV